MDELPQLITNIFILNNLSFEFRGSPLLKNNLQSYQNFSCDNGPVPIILPFLSYL